MDDAASFRRWIEEEKLVCFNFKLRGLTVAFPFPEGEDEIWWPELCAMAGANFRVDSDLHVDKPSAAYNCFRASLLQKEKERKKVLGLLTQEEMQDPGQEYAAVLDSAQEESSHDPLERRGARQCSQVETGIADLHVKIVGSMDEHITVRQEEEEKAMADRVGREEVFLLGMASDVTVAADIPLHEEEEEKADRVCLLKGIAGKDQGNAANLAESADDDDWSLFNQRRTQDNKVVDPYDDGHSEMQV